MSSAEEPPSNTGPPTATAHEFFVTTEMRVAPDAIFRAWTEQFDTWFAARGALRMRADVGEPYWFEVVHEGLRHPHYGRFLALEPGRLIEQTWVSGDLGTKGAETVVRIELTASPTGTHLRLSHRGFLDAESADRHERSWPRILSHLDETLTAAS